MRDETGQIIVTTGPARALKRMDGFGADRLTIMYRIQPVASGSPVWRSGQDHLENEQAPAVPSVTPPASANSQYPYLSFSSGSKDIGSGLMSTLSRVPAPVESIQNLAGVVRKD